MKGTCMQIEKKKKKKEKKGRWKDMNAHWNEYERNIWKENEGN